MGGYDKNGGKCDDLWEFNFHTTTWRRIIPAIGKIPELFHHTAIVYSGSMIIFGGHKQNPAELYEYRFCKETKNYLQEKMINRNSLLLNIQQQTSSGRLFRIPNYPFPGGVIDRFCMTSTCMFWVVQI